MMYMVLKLNIYLFINYFLMSYIRITHLYRLTVGRIIRCLRLSRHVLRLSTVRTFN